MQEGCAGFACAGVVAVDNEVGSRIAEGAGRAVLVVEWGWGQPPLVFGCNFFALGGEGQGDHG
ncbi:MAG: hypothetical protein D6835_03475, partial [Candidatus Thermofonsia bacterium]